MGAIDAEGKPRRHWAYPAVWVTNAYGDYNSTFMPEVVKEIVRKYDIDRSARCDCWSATVPASFDVTQGWVVVEIPVIERLEVVHIS